MQVPKKYVQINEMTWSNIKKYEICKSSDYFNGLQVDREFTKSLIMRDSDDVLKNPFRYVNLFLLHTLLSKKNSENRHARPVTEGPKLRCNTPPIERGSGPYKSRFLSNQFYLSETLETWSVSRNRWQEITQ